MINCFCQVLLVSAAFATEHQFLVRNQYFKTSSKYTVVENEHSAKECRQIRTCAAKGDWGIWGCSSILKNFQISSSILSSEHATMSQRNKLVRLAAAMSENVESSHYQHLQNMVTTDLVEKCVLPESGLPTVDVGADRSQSRTITRRWSHLCKRQKHHLLLHAQVDFPALLTTCMSTLPEWIIQCPLVDRQFCFLWPPPAASAYFVWTSITYYPPVCWVSHYLLAFSDAFIYLFRLKLSSLDTRDATHCFPISPFVFAISSCTGGQDAAFLRLYVPDSSLLLDPPPNRWSASVCKATQRRTTHRRRAHTVLAE